MTTIVTVSPREAGLRLDHIVARHVEGMSVRVAARLIMAGVVRVNGRTASKGLRLREGDRIEMHDVDSIRSDGDFDPPPDPGVGIVVLLRDERLLVADKPAGMHSAPVRGGERPTLVGAVVASVPEAARVRGHSAREAGLVHRLDQATSGACLFALDQDAFDRLSTANESDLVVKDYLAVVEGHVPEGLPTLEAEIPAGLSRGRRVHVRSVRRLRARSLAHATGPDGTRLARMRVEVTGRSARHCLVQVKLTRGFRHQVRSVLAAIGHPITGDEIYGGRVCLAGLMLHASRIVFPHPTDGRLVRVDSPPVRIEECWARVRGGTFA